MLLKLFILYENRIINNKFLLEYNKNKIIIKLANLLEGPIKILVYNNYNGITYIPICFPLELIIYNNRVFNPYIILSSYNLKINNELDFFNQLEYIINQKYNLTFFNFNDLLEDKNNILINIINDNYLTELNTNINTIILDDLNNIKFKTFDINNISSDIIQEMNTSDIISDETNLTLQNTDLLKITNLIWLKLCLLKLYIIYILYIFPDLSNKTLKEISIKYNISKKILSCANIIRLFKYNLFDDINNSFTLTEYLNKNFKKSIKLVDIKSEYYYYILSNNSESEIKICDKVPINSITSNKIIKISINNINKNIITINKNKNILYDNYKWYYFYPLIIINKESVIYQTYINYNFNNEIIKQILGLENKHILKIMNYYNNNKISNLVSLSEICKDTIKYLSDFYILKSGSYSKIYFEYITKKYLNDENNIIKILEILFINYNYPLKTNRHDMDPIFDYIIYFSLYNHNIILNNNIINQKIINIIPSKLKNLYIILLKTLRQSIDNNFELITYNQKIYNDFLYKNIIKLFLSTSDFLSVIYFKEEISQINYNIFKNIFITNILLIDISNKLTWSNLPKKLNYLNYFYKNNDIIYYQDKINKNIIYENLDTRIIKIIENPFNMYKYLRKEKDFNKWTKYIADKLTNLYYIPISLSSDDLLYIGQLIFLLVNINTQNLKDSSYINFINFCNLHNKLILNTNRINIKIKELFPHLKCNINLGFLAKHIILCKELIIDEKNNSSSNSNETLSQTSEILSQNEIIYKSDDIISLENKLHITLKKYSKYKAKYLESKDINKSNLSVI